MRKSGYRHGPRSNMYSKSKYSNWRSYDPFESETVPGTWRPVKIVERPGEKPLPIYAFPCHSEFIQPCSPEEIALRLSTISPSFLSGIQEIILLGGTRKQDRSAQGNLFHYGCYWYGSKIIKLHAYPRRRLRFRDEVSPGTRRVRQSLKEFYLNDTLLHEVGHHVDNRAWRPCRNEAEAYADWFVEDCRKREKDIEMANK